MKLRRLNNEGILIFQNFLESLATDPATNYPETLLTDPMFSDEVCPVIEVEKKTFSTRYDVAEYLYRLFSESGLKDIERDRGLWTWLSLFYFEALCPKNKHGHRKPRELSRWILNISAWRYYRHLLAGPFLIYRHHADSPRRTLALLCDPPHQASDVYLEFADTQQFITNPSVIEAATRLYYDSSNRKKKRGTARNAPGGARRMAMVLAQFDCTWDLFSVNPEGILGLLPSEFDRFKNGNQRFLFEEPGVAS